MAPQILCSKAGRHGHFHFLVCTVGDDTAPGVVFANGVYGPRQLLPRFGWCEPSLPDLPPVLDGDVQMIDATNDWVRFAGTVNSCDVMAVPLAKRDDWAVTIRLDAEPEMGWKRLTHLH